VTELHKYKFSHGGFSCEVEGTPAFIEEKLEQLLDTCFKISAKAGISSTPIIAANTANNGKLETSYDQGLSTNTIALTTGAKTGSSLVIAAIAHLQLVKGSTKVTRQEIAEEIKTATTFYKTTYTSNLSAYLDSLTKSRRLNLIAKDTYSLTSSERQRLSEAISKA